MKNKILSAILFLVALIATSCGYDNFEAPESLFSGRIVYQGEPLGFEYDNPYMELWEEGWTSTEAIRVNLNLDGSFSQLLFDGTYKMVFPKARSPFIFKDPANPTSDTMTLVIKGNKTMDIEVTPFFIIKDPQYTYNPDTDKMEATCAVEQIVPDKSLSNVRVYVGKTSHLYAGSHINWHTLNMGNNPGTGMDDWFFSGPVVNKANFPTAQDYCYVRMSLQVGGHNCWLASPVEKYVFD